jgi:hypothetical protein
MKRYLIHCETAWCGCYDWYSAEAESEFELEDIAEQLAYETFQTYCSTDDILEAEGYNSDELSDEKIDAIMADLDESSYYWYNIEEFEGSDEEFESYCKAI